VEKPLSFATPIRLCSTSGSYLMRAALNHWLSMMFSTCLVSETRPNETSLIEYQAQLEADNVRLKVAGNFSISVFYTPDPQIVQKHQVFTCIPLVQDTKALKTNIFTSICQYALHFMKFHEKSCERLMTLCIGRVEVNAVG